MGVVASGTVEYPNGGAGSTTFVLPLPGAAAAGDIILMLAVTNASAATLTSGPAGATQAFAGASAAPYGDAYDSGVYLYPVPSSPAASFTFTWSAVTRGSLVWTVVRGAQLAGWAANVSAFSFTSAPTAPAVTAAAGAFVLGGVNGGFKSADVTDPSGWTVLANGGNRKGHLSSKGVQASAGSTGAAGFTIVGEQDAARAWQLALSAAPVTSTSGTASSTLEWAGSASGSIDAAGSAAGTLTWEGAAVGSTQTRGTAASALEWVAAASGSTQNSGTAASTLTWTGAAAGHAPGGATGSASSTLEWVSTASGVTHPHGTSEDSITWEGAAVGVMQPHGSATGALAWVGAASGHAPGVARRSGSASSTLTWAGAAVGSIVTSGSAVSDLNWVFTSNTLRDITVTAILDPQRWGGTLEPDRWGGILEKQRWAGRLE